MHLSRAFDAGFETMSDRLLTAEREQAILRLLHKRRVMSVSALSSALNVSEATIRRDLQSMHERRLLQRIRGGAARNGLARVEPVFSDKESQNTAEKERIARRALDLIEDHDTIYLDGGSTVLALARLLDVRDDLTIVTNSLMAAGVLMTSRHRLILSGGEFRALSRTLVGPLTSPVIRSLTVDKAFMGTIGFTIPDGMTTTDPGEAYTKEQIMERSHQVILLVDSSKLGVDSFARSDDMADLDAVVTDAASADFQKRLGDHTVTLIKAE